MLTDDEEHGYHPGLFGRGEFSKWGSSYFSPVTPILDLLGCILSLSAQYKRAIVCYKEKQVLRQQLFEDLLPIPVDAPNSPFRGGDITQSLVIPNLPQVCAPSVRAPADSGFQYP